MRVSYHEAYYVPLPEKHPFPMGKYPALYHYLLSENLIKTGNVVRPNEAELQDLILVHTAEYVHGVIQGTLSSAAIRILGMPWSSGLVRRSLLACQGTINAALMALHDGWAANLAGGTHHAFPEHGEGYCVFNDVAIAIRVLQQAKWIRRALVVDLDVHQGNGTAYIFRNDPTVFTFSMHGEKNYPFHKQTSDLDVALPDGLSDDGYMDCLRRFLPQSIALAQPDVAFYLAGVDVLAGDRLGRLNLSPWGLRQREYFVLKALHAAQIPVCITLSGGYAASAEETARMHAICYQEARSIFG